MFKEMKPPLHIGSKRKVPCLPGRRRTGPCARAGRVSKSDHPSPEHASLNYEAANVRRLDHLMPCCHAPMARVRCNPTGSVPLSVFPGTDSQGRLGFITFYVYALSL